MDFSIFLLCQFPYFHDRLTGITFPVTYLRHYLRACFLGNTTEILSSAALYHLQIVDWKKKKKKHHLKVENYALLGGFFFFLFFLVGAVSPDDSLLDCSEGFSPRGKGGTSIKKSVYSKSQVVETSKDARNQISPGNEFSTFLWEDVRVWAHENHSLDMHLTHLGAVSCFSPAWVPLGCTAGGSCRDWGFDGCNIFCLLIRQVKFFIHKIYS